MRLHIFIHVILCIGILNRLIFFLKEKIMFPKFGYLILGLLNHLSVILTICGLIWFTLFGIDLLISDYFGQPIPHQ